eukprot:6213222-Pleurochrysis_carterae.AAC.3
MPSIVDLQKRDACAVLTFPMCALGARVQKYTTFICTPGLQLSLACLADLTCSHSSHERQVGGNRDADGWSSASHAAYPPDLNLLIAKSIAAHTTHVPPRTTPSVRLGLDTSSRSSDTQHRS